MTTIEFVVPTFNQSFNMTETGTLLAPQLTSIPAHDAVAVFNIQTSDMQNVFQYQTNDININDVDTQDLKYYVRLTDGNSSAHGNPVWPLNLTLNPANAMMNDTYSFNGIDIADTNISASEKLVKHDFLRYLSLKLFNTSKGVDLFANSLGMKENISGLCGNFTGEVYNTIYNLLSAISTTSSSNNVLLHTDSSNNNIRYLANDTPDNSNITRMLMNQIAQYAPARYNAITDGLTDFALRPVPFIDGDVLNFTVVFNAAPGQESLTSVSPIPSRTYLIKLVLGSGSLTNTQVNDSALVGDCAYANFIPTIVPALSDPTTPIYGGNDIPTAVPAPYNYFGWYYLNNPAVRGGKINWYFAPNTSTSTVANITSVYFTARVISLTTLPFITIYTARTGSGDATGWYHSKIAYVASSVTITDNFDCQFGFDLTGVDGGVTAGFASNQLAGYTNVAMTKSTVVGSNAGPFAGSEQILYYTIQTNSGATAGSAEFILTSMVFCETNGEVVTNKVYNFQPF